MTTNKYLSNATKKGYSPRVAYGMLLNEFKKGNVSYPRTDGINHAPLKILEAKVDNRVREWIVIEPQFDIEDLGDYLFVSNADPFIMNEFLNLSTPATILKDYENGLLLDFSFEPNKYIGIDYKLEEERLSKNKIELTEFSFEDILKDIIADELNIEEDSIEVEINTELDFVLN